MNTLEEKILIVRLKNGDREAYGRIYDHYIERIYRFIFFKVSSDETAKDLTSDCFLKVFEYILQTDQEIKNVQALLYRTARNLVIDHYRSRAKETVSIEKGYKVTSDGYGSENNLIINLEQERILKAVKELDNEEWQEIILLKFVDGYSTTEIAQIMEKKNGAIRTALSRAMAELKKIISS